MSIGGLVSLFVFAGIFVLLYLAGRHFLLVTLGLGGGVHKNPDALDAELWRRWAGKVRWGGALRLRNAKVAGFSGRSDLDTHLDT